MFLIFRIKAENVLNIALNFSSLESSQSLKDTVEGPQITSKMYFKIEKVITFKIYYVLSFFASLLNSQCLKKIIFLPVSEPQCSYHVLNFLGILTSYSYKKCSYKKISVVRTKQE